MLCDVFAPIQLHMSIGTSAVYILRRRSLQAISFAGWQKPVSPLLFLFMLVMPACLLALLSWKKVFEVVSGHAGSCRPIRGGH